VSSPSRDELDVLVVGAGPTGLALAAQLQAYGIRFRMIDRSADRAHESRALAVQARTLELLQDLNLADALVARGNRSARVMIHVDGRTAAEAELADFGRDDTRFPFVLFVSQAETEALLGEHLAAGGAKIERSVELSDFVADQHGVACVLVHPSGREERVRTRYLAGCDGAHSTVRKGAGIGYEGDAYPRDFLLGDVEADTSLRRDTIHPFVGPRGIAIFFPLGHPATWRVIAVDGDTGATGELALEELQRSVDGATGGGVRLSDPAWLARFRLHHRQAAAYASGRVFLAGDAAHIHSPVGAQGMNTGIQDAWNLGWKLALVLTGRASPEILGSYHAERWPVGHFLLRTTDRAFSLVTRVMSPGRIGSWVRREVVARLLPRVLSSRRLRASAFHFVSELGIHYRESPLAREGTPRLDGGPMAGDRLPDARITRDGWETHLQRELAGPDLQLLLCGPIAAWERKRLDELAGNWRAPVVTEYLTPHASPTALVDTHGEALRRLGVSGSAQYLVRPDGYVGFRCAGTDPTQMDAYMHRWFAPAAPAPRR
jgi:2-polyprenyl-6-methoxyphenol hydroxylase-like FAD-dependent oxidoreductase